MRRVWLVVHVAASGSWLGLAVGLLGLGLVAASVVSSFAYFFMTAISVLK
ncbi:hypothetical protein ACFYM2_03155 [Streptomyces sp. NPDC006711]